MDDMFAVKDACLIIRMPRETDHHAADKIRMRADEILLSGKACNVVFDFENTAFMDSSGIGVIAGRYKKVSCLGGKIVVINANHRIQKILSMSGLKDMIEMI